MDSLNFAEHPACRTREWTDPSCFLLFHTLLILPSRRKEGGFKAEALSPLFHGVTTHPSSLLRPSDVHKCAHRRAYILPRSFLLTLAFSCTIPPFSSQSEDQLEWLGVLRVPAIIPRQSLISSPANSTLLAPQSRKYARIPAIPLSHVRALEAHFPPPPR